MRGVLVFCGAAFLLLASAGEVCAHGGNFRRANPNPGPRVPGPGVTPPRLPGPVTGRRDPLLRDPLAGIRTDWWTWWQLNAEAWDLPRGVFLLHGRIAVTPSDEAPSEARDGADLEPRRIHRLLLDRARKRVVLPFLRHVVDPKAEAAPELVAAALIAWARMDTDGESIPVLVGYASNNRAHAEVRESAVLGLGLLRRTDAALQRPVSELEALRDLLIALYDDAKNTIRVRAWALYALALLADQPYGDGSLERHGLGVTRQLWRRLQADHVGPDLPNALLVALGMQPPEGVPDGLRADLRRLVLNGRPLWTDTQRAHALHAYVRLRAPDRVLMIRHALTSRRASDRVRMSAAAANALAETAPTLSSVERRDAARWMLELVASIENEDVAGLGILALGALLGADVRDGSSALLEETDVAPYLFRTAREGEKGLRPYAAFAIALAARSDRLHSRPAAVFRAKATRALATGVARTRGSDEIVSPHVAAAGLARAEEARAELIKIVGNKHRFPDIRGHAARALGLLGRADEKTVALLLAATRDRVHPFVQTQAVRALGMLAAPGACNELLDQLQECDPSRGVAVSVALALGRLGDPKAADRLVLLARNETAGLHVRTMAVVALGLIFDPESPPSRARLRTFANYFGLTRHHRAALDIL